MSAVFATLFSVGVSLDINVLESETLPLEACEFRVEHLNFYRMHRIYWCELTE